MARRIENVVFLTNGCCQGRAMLRELVRSRTDLNLSVAHVILPDLGFSARVRRTYREKGVPISTIVSDLLPLCSRRSSWPEITNYFTRNSFIAPTWPGELYWNFGVPGIIIGLGLLGAAARWAYRRYGTQGLGVVPCAICILVMVNLVMMLENHIAPSIAGTVRTLIILEVLRTVGRHYGLIVRDPVEVVGST